jgi:hypothetical protein
MSENRPYRTRTTVLFAAAAPKAVVLRRRPRQHYHLIAWDLDTDAFTHGQWMKGNVQLADLSPTGTKLLYFAEQLHAKAIARAAGPYDPLRQVPRRAAQPRRARKVPRYQRTWGRGKRAPREIKGSWTAISTPPYFSALALWPSIGRWTGGGIFLAERDLVLWEPEDGITAIENVPMPTSVRVRSWQQVPRGGLPSAYQPSPRESDAHARIARALIAAGLMWVDWISLPQGDDMLFAGDGRIFRLRRWRSHAEGQYLAKADTLADLRDLSFQQVRPASEAMRW